MLTNIALGRGYFKFFDVEKFNILKMVTFIKASFSLIWSKGNFFRVTPKSVEASLKKKDKRELTVHLALLSLIAASILFASFNSIWAVFILYPSFIAVAFALFWSIFNLFLLALAMHEVLSRLYMRQDYRFSLSLCGHVSSAADTKYRVDINNISRGGLSMHCSDMSKKRWIERRNGIGINTTVSIELPEGDIILPGQIVYDKESSNSLRSIGFKFGVLPDEIRMRLYNFLFVTAPRNIYSRKDFICPASTRQLLRSSAHINQGVS
jgi:cellulose synthase (UDP-forming)